MKHTYQYVYKMVYNSDFIFKAEHHSYLLRQLKKNFPLSGEESRILMKGRNASSKRKNRRNRVAYQDSTALEALVGYMYTSDPNRCQELLAWLESVIDNLEE